MVKSKALLLTGNDYMNIFFNDQECGGIEESFETSSQLLKKPDISVDKNLLWKLSLLYLGGRDWIDLLWLGILRDKKIGIKLCTSLMKINKITPSVVIIISSKV